MLRFAGLGGARTAPSFDHERASGGRRTERFQGQMMMTLVAQILDDAVADKLRDENPAR